MLRVATGPAEDVLNMTGHSGVSASTYLVTIPINIVLAVALIIPFGANGAAAATGIALVIRGVWLAMAARRRLGVDTTLLAVLPERKLQPARCKRLPSKALVARDEEQPAAVRRDADAEGRVAAVGAHVLVVGGTHQCEELHKL